MPLCISLDLEVSRTTWPEAVCQEPLCDSVHNNGRTLSVAQGPAATGISDAS